MKQLIIFLSLGVFFFASCTSEVTVTEGGDKTEAGSEAGGAVIEAELAETIKNFNDGLKNWTKISDLKGKYGIELNGENKMITEKDGYTITEKYIPHHSNKDMISKYSVQFASENDEIDIYIPEEDEDKYETDEAYYAEEERLEKEAVKVLEANKKKIMDLVKGQIDSKMKLGDFNGNPCWTYTDDELGEIYFELMFEDDYYSKGFSINVW